MNKEQILENINNIVGENLDEVFEKIETLNTVVAYQTYMLNNRTCDNCSQKYKEFGCDIRNAIGFNFCDKNNFGCNKWEQK